MAQNNKEITVLYLSYDGLTDPLGQSQVLPYIIGLSKRNYSFVVISFEKEKNYTEHSEKILELTLKNNIEWIPLTYHYTPKVLSTVYDCVMMWLKAKEISKTHSIKAVHCRSYIPALIGLGLKKKFGIKFIFDMRGFWIEERIEGGLWNPTKLIYKMVIRFFRNKEKKFLDSADAIICLTSKAKKNLETRNISYSKKLTVIPCCVDTEKFSYEKFNDTRLASIKKELQINDNEFVLSYLGSIGTWYQLDEMVLFFKECLKIKKDCRFLFISNDNHAHIQSTALKYGIPSEKLIFKKLPNDLVPLYLSVSNYSIFFIKNSFSKQASSPTKQGEIMALGIPVICNTGIGDTDDIVTNYKSGLLLNQYSTEQFANIAHLIMEGSIIWDKESIRKGALDYFSLSKGVDQYFGVYRSIFQPL